MASWLKKIKKKIATFLAIISMLTVLIAIPVMCLAGVGVPIVIAVGAIAIGVGALAFVIDADGAAAAFTKVGDGVANFAGSAAEALGKTVAAIGGGATAGLLTNPVVLIAIVVGGFILYEEYFSEKGGENVSISIEPSSGALEHQENRSIPYQFD